MLPLNLSRAATFLLVLNIISHVVAPNTRSGRDYGAESRHSRRQRATTRPYDIEDRHHGSNRSRRGSRRGRDDENERELVSYPPLPQQHHAERGPRDRGTGRRCNPPPPSAPLPTARQSLPVVNHGIRVQRWDNPFPVWPLSGGPRPVPPPVRNNAANPTPRIVQSPLCGGETGLVLATPAITRPPPPQWRGFLRDLLISLGYSQATAVWPRTERFLNGNYGPNVRTRQRAHLEWCRNIVIGLER